MPKTLTAKEILDSFDEHNQRVRKKLSEANTTWGLAYAMNLGSHIRMTTPSFIGDYHGKSTKGS